MKFWLKADRNLCEAFSKWLTIARKHAALQRPRTEFQPYAANLRGDGYCNFDRSFSRFAGGDRYGRRMARMALVCIAKESAGLRAHVEVLSDRQWELREAEERMKSLLEAQGDLIVRRDSEGRIAYANDAYCALAGTATRQADRSAVPLSVMEQGAVQFLADGTRVHDQKIETQRTRAGFPGTKCRCAAKPNPQHKFKASAAISPPARSPNANSPAHAIRPMRPIWQRAVSLQWCRTRSARRLNGILGMADLLHDTTLTAEQESYVGAVQNFRGRRC